MLAFVARRLAAAVLLLGVISVAVFAIFFLIPRLGGSTPEDLASRYVGRTADAATVELMADKLGFDDPVYVQYARFAKGIFAGADFDYGPGVEHCPAPCFGYSFITQRPVWPDLMDRLPITASLAVGAAVLWVGFGVATGVVSAVRRGSAFDRSAMGVALAGVSLPIFFTGLASLALFSYHFGWTAPGGSYTSLRESPLRWAHDLLLPWITLSFLYAAGYARLTRAGMLETMGEDYIRTARAKGLPERTVVIKHGLRAALTPILTIFGLDLGLLLGGAILTESTFSLPGIGKYAIDAIFANDLPKVLGTVMLGAFFIVIANLVVDILYAVVDPKVRT